MNILRSIPTLLWAILLLIVVGVSSYFYGRSTVECEVTTVTQTVYVDRPLAPSDTARSSTPDGTTVYLPPVNPPVVVNVPVPPELITDRSPGSGWQNGVSQPRIPIGNIPTEPDTVNYDYKFKLLPANGVLVTRGNTRITAYDPNIRTWTQDDYAHPAPSRWSRGVTLTGTSTVYGSGPEALSLTGTLGYGRISVMLGPAAVTDIGAGSGVSLGVIAGVSYKVF